MQTETFLSTTEVAKLLGVSRIAIFKRIKAGHLRARRIGRRFVVEKKELHELLEHSLSDRRKHEIEAAVAKTVREYGETLRLLGQE